MHLICVHVLVTGKPVAQFKHYVRPMGRRIYFRGKISAETLAMLTAAAERMGFRYNKPCMLIEVLGSRLVAIAESLPKLDRRYGRVPPEAVRAIRASKDKIAAIAAEYRLSEAMVIKIRKRTCYRWVE